MFVPISCLDQVIPMSLGLSIFLIMKSLMSLDLGMSSPFFFLLLEKKIISNMSVFFHFINGWALRVGKSMGTIGQGWMSGGSSEGDPELSASKWSPGSSSGSPGALRTGVLGCCVRSSGVVSSGGGWVSWGAYVQASSYQGFLGATAFFFLGSI